MDSTPETGSSWNSLAGLIELRGRESRAHVFLEDARSARAIDYSTLAARVREWRTLFGSLGLAAQAPIIVAAQDPMSFAIVHLAAISSGLRSVPLDPSLPNGEPGRTSDLIGGAALVVTDKELASPKYSGAMALVDARTGSPVHELFDGEAMAGAGAPTPGSAVLFTSGSTGTPKGVELPEQQLLFVASQVAGNNRLVAADRGFNSLPLFHVNAQVVGLLATLVAGSTLVIDSSFHRTGFWELLAERRVTWLNAVPAILAVLTRDGADIPDLGLRFIRSASAPLPDAVREALGEIPLVLSWGMTEGASQIAVTPLGDSSHPGSVGLPAGSEIRVRSESGVDAPNGEVGALWIRGPGVVSSYLFGRAPERFDSDGWLDTGDVGRIDPDGYVYLQGRSDDVINRGGEKVYPAELEEVLLGDPRVLEAVVVAIPHDVLGSVPKAYIIPVAADEVDSSSLVDDLRARCERELPRFKRPAQIEVVVDLPRAPTGTVQRSRVRTLAATGAVETTVA
jgi:acyl-CoA synthetase (AMP-forming)/AMP-acid ligase II